LTDKESKRLSIQVSLNGLSFCIYDNFANRFIYTNTIPFDKKQNPIEALEYLKAELASNIHFSDDFETVTIIHYNELATLVPESLYNEANNAEYLKYNSKILKTDFIASDKLKYQDIISVYVPYVNINNYIFDTFGEFTYTHAATLFTDATTVLNSDSDDINLYINIQGKTMQLVAYKTKKLQFYNFFEFSTAEDFIYYILFTCEQQQLDPETLHLYIVGDIENNDENFKIAYKYIRHVEILKGATDFLIKSNK